MTDMTSERLKFWEARSILGFAAGSGDTNLKRIEIKAIQRSLGMPDTVLDAGCGNGYTLTSLASEINNCNFFGFDYSSGMVDEARRLIKERGLLSRVSICQASLLSLSRSSLDFPEAPHGGFDCIYTERSIINLDTLQEQATAVQALWDMVNPKGRLILCEAFLDGLREINFFRESIGLHVISPPWHNRYLSLSEVSDFLPGLDQKPEIVEFSGTYYFVSRVVHARASHLAGRDPSYDDPINEQSLDLPALPVCGQSKIVIFRKK
jgi:SAM-dependent methyltransferase